MLDKDGEEHRAVENVLLRRTKAALHKLLECLTVEVAEHHASTSAVAHVRNLIDQRQRHVQQLRALGTGASR